MSHNQFGSLCWSALLFLLGCIFIASSPSAFVAASYEDSADLRVAGSPLSSVTFLYPSETAISEKLNPSRARIESLLGAQAYGFQKKFDSLSGGTFGKRQV